MTDNNIDLQAIETKLAAARTKLILDKPFLGALVLRLPMVAARDDWCPTTATDAKTFYYNPAYIAALSLNQTQFMLAHESLHCALSHFMRRQHRVKHRWDLACDYAINPLLIADGLQPPPSMPPVMYQYEGMTAEEIYPLLDDNDETETLDKHVYDQENDSGGSQNNPPQQNQPSDQQSGKAPEPEQDSDNPAEQQKPQQNPDSQQNANPQPGQGNQTDDSNGADAPPPLTAQERETLAAQWQQRMAGAAQQALQAGKLGGSLARMIDHLLQPQLPWRMLLARYLTATAKDDFSYMRPSRREGAAILPTLRSSQIDVVIAIDTSGSIKPSEIDEFLSEIEALKAQMRARIILLACDATLAKGAPWIFESWEEIRLPDQLSGGGGTSFVPVYDWVAQQDVSPQLLVYFTDAEGEFPAHEPPYPVLWLVKGKEKVPWGQRVQLN
ncbi:MAG: VWA-like domain-containing protein [Chromatiales bacterium]|jgi:predicted metal-dependent peptidase